MPSTNLIHVKNNYQILLDLRRSALLDTLETRENIERTSDVTYIEDDHPDLVLPTTIFNIIDKAVQEYRAVLINEVPSLERDLRSS